MHIGASYPASSVASSPLANTHAEVTVKCKEPRSAHPCVPTLAEQTEPVT